jgi:hypothetical protein
VLILKNALPARHRHQKLVEVYRTRLVQVNLVDNVLHFCDVVIPKIFFVHFEQLADLNCSAVVDVHGLENVSEFFPLLLVDFSQGNKCFDDGDEVVAAVVFLQIFDDFGVDDEGAGVFHFLEPFVLEGAFGGDSFALISVEHGADEVFGAVRDLLPDFTFEGDDFCFDVFHGLLGVAAFERGNTGQ